MEKNHILTINSFVYRHINPTLTVMVWGIKRCSKVTYRKTEEFTSDIRGTRASPLFYNLVMV